MIPPSLSSFCTSRICKYCDPKPISEKYWYIKMTMMDTDFEAIRIQKLDNLITTIMKWINHQYDGIESYYFRVLLFI